ncbi:MAG: hypothetical protein AAFN77_06360 [Planctomycetota bacterium]
MNSNPNFERTKSIVEDLRADVDFELDDVIASIVHGLPDEYFVTLSDADQLKPLKALLAMGICHLDDEIMMRSEDGQQIAVVAKRNYPGQLANILQRLPNSNPLISAKIFTSTDHDFIIDVFDFETDRTHTGGEQEINRAIIADEVAELTHRTVEEIRDFVTHYHPASSILNSAKQVAEQFLAFKVTEQSGGLALRWSDQPEQTQTRITVSASQVSARSLLQFTSEFLGDQKFDIEQAWLHDVPLDDQESSHVALVSFLIVGNVPRKTDAFGAYLKERFGADS